MLDLEGLSLNDIAFLTMAGRIFENTSGNIANGTRRTLVLEKMIGSLPQNANRAFVQTKTEL
jgi:hypothetical protein